VVFVGNTNVFIGNEVPSYQVANSNKANLFFQFKNRQLNI
jgi:hypothetical protein